MTCYGSHATAVGVRVVTDLGGGVVGVVGIDRVPRKVTLESAAGTLTQLVKPNEEWAVVAGKGGSLSASLQRAAPFVEPFE